MPTAIIFDPQTGAATGARSSPEPIGSGEMACSAEQAREYWKWRVVGGALVPAPSSPAMLRAYADDKRRAVEQQQITVNVAPQGQPAKNAVVDMTPDGQRYVASAVQRVTLAPSASVNWQQAGGALALNADEVRALGAAVSARVEASWAAYAAVVAAIEAATLTTTAQIDAFAWPGA